MKPKDIITVVVALAVVAVSGYFIYTMLFPSQKNNENTQSKTDSTIKVPASIDEKTFTTVSTLSDYGKPGATGLGKTDLFGDY